MRLLQLNKPFPRGGYPFKDPRTGQEFNAMVGGVRQRILQIIQHRQMNPRIYPATETQYLTFDGVWRELTDYLWPVYEKNPRRNRYFMDTTPPAPIPAPPAVCQKCNVAVKPVYCPTCSGQRLRYYECPTCKQRWKK